MRGCYVQIRFAKKNEVVSDKTPFYLKGPFFPPHSICLTFDLDGRFLIEILLFQSQQYQYKTFPQFSITSFSSFRYFVSLVNNFFSNLIRKNRANVFLAKIAKFNSYEIFEVVSFAKNHSRKNKTSLSKNLSRILVLAKISSLNPLRANPTKWSNTLKQFCFQC